MKLTVLGALKSKANSRRMVRSGNRTLFIKSKGAMEFVEGAEWQLKVQYKGQPIESQVKLKLDIYYPNNRSDLSPELFFDCLQSAGVLKNDRQIIEYSCRKLIDKENPRVICELEEI